MRGAYRLNKVPPKTRTAKSIQVCLDIIKNALASDFRKGDGASRRQERQACFNLISERNLWTRCEILESEIPLELGIVVPDKVQNKKCVFSVLARSLPESTSKLLQEHERAVRGS